MTISDRISVFLAVALCLAASPSAAQETLHALTECPDTAKQTCFVGGIWASDPARGRLRQRTREHVIIRTFLVDGSLAGGETKPYTLQSILATDDYFATTRHSGPVALMGDFDGSPLVLTNRGPLLILSQGVQIEDEPNVVVIDERRWRVLARYYSCVHASYFAPPLRSLIWDQGGQSCVSTHSTPTGIERHKATACARPRGTQCGDYPVGLAPEKISVQRLGSTIRELNSLSLDAIDGDGEGTSFGGTGWGVEVYRVPHTHLIVVYGYCADCVDPPYELGK